MRTPWGRKRRRLEQLERIVAARIQLWDPDGNELVSATVEELYLVAKFGHGGRLDIDDQEGSFTFRC